jgi:predicted protein tyrosine phosphatase
MLRALLASMNDYNENEIAERLNNSSRIVFNMSRREAREWNAPLDPSKTVWISIKEPRRKKSSVQNEILESLPNLKLQFWDIEIPTTDFNSKKLVYPVDDLTVRKLVYFLKEHEGKNILVNCAAGISRSGAIAKFCENFLSYKLEEQGKDRLNHNKYVYQKIIQFFYE